MIEVINRSDVASPWVLERTFTWLSRNPCLDKDFELSGTRNGESGVYILISDLAGLPANLCRCGCLDKKKSGPLLGTLPGFVSDVGTGIGATGG